MSGFNPGRSQGYNLAQSISQRWDCVCRFCLYPGLAPGHYPRFAPGDLKKTALARGTTMGEYPFRHHNPRSARIHSRNWQKPEFDPGYNQGHCRFRRHNLHVTLIFPGYNPGITTGLEENQAWTQGTTQGQRWQRCAPRSRLVRYRAHKMCLHNIMQRSLRAIEKWTFGSGVCTSCAHIIRTAPATHADRDASTYTTTMG
jgi:hypothetical protein